MRNHLVVVTLLVALSACSSAPAGPYTATFDEAGQWTQTSDSQADIFVQDGQLHIVVKQPDTLAWSVAGLALGDFTLDVEATPIEGPADNGYGLVVRRVDDENLYCFQISSDGYFRVQKRVKGKWIDLTGDWQASPAIQKGQANRLRVTCKRDSLTFAANDAQLVRITDGEFARGDIGVVASTLGEPGVHVAFDNVNVITNP